MEWLRSNIGSIIAGTVVFITLGVVAFKMIKTARSSGGGGCPYCSARENCALKKQG